MRIWTILKKSVRAIDGFGNERQLKGHWKTSFYWAKEVQAEQDRIADKINKQEAEIKRLNGLIVDHHNVTEAHKIMSGQFCPICMKEEKRLLEERKK